MVICQFIGRVGSFFRDSLGMNYMFGFTSSIRMKIFSYPSVLSVWYVAILRYIAPAEVIRLLLQADRNRASIMMKTRDDGMLPLHIGMCSVIRTHPTGTKC